jgi:hypothetical protein
MEYGIPETLEVTLDGETFRGRPLPATRVGEIQREHTTYQTVRGQVVEVRDLPAIGKRIFVETVTGWDGPTKGGAPWECTPEARAELHEDHPDRAAAVLAALDRVKEALRTVKRGN